MAPRKTRQFLRLANALLQQVEFFEAQ